MSSKTNKGPAIGQMKWPPCEITDAGGNKISPIRFAVEDQGDRVVLLPEAYAALVGKVNAGIKALERAKEHILDLKAEQGDETPAPAFIAETLKEMKR